MEDGLPAYEPVVRIRKSVPPNTELDYDATEEHIADFPDEYRVFEKTRLARNTVGVKGYPLALWPVIGPADLAMLQVRDILTVEQLAPLAMKQDVPAPVRELAHRAKRLIEMQGKIGKFEELVEQYRSERDAMVEQLREANATISAQNALINSLKMMAVGQQPVPMAVGAS
jgi:hypothetical protein